MFKFVADHVWAFDSEWVPDAAAGRALFDLPSDMPDGDVFQRMWEEAGADDDNPRPFLKLVQCRVVSIALVRRFTARDGQVRVELRSRPRDPGDPASSKEAAIVGGFLDNVGRYKPQLVGFNSHGSDLPILIQRAIVGGLRAADYCRRPDKPWEGKDYFARGGDWNIDLMQAIGGFGAARPSLRELAALSGIPSKLGEFDGSDVSNAWLDGDIAQIVRYNEQDALTTYLVWLRIAHFGGHFTPSQYRAEQVRLREMLERKAAEPQNAHIAQYLSEWDRLGSIGA